MGRLSVSAFVATGSLVSIVLGCGDDGVTPDDRARRGYLGFELAIERAVEVAVVGYNTSTGPSIIPQTISGDEGGRLVVAGQVTEGITEDDADLDLTITVTGYSDGRIFDGESNTNFHVSYSSLENRPLLLELSLRDVPDGSYSGMIRGSTLVFDDLGGEVGFDLSLEGELVEAAVGDALPVNLDVRGVVSLGRGEYVVNSLF